MVYICQFGVNFNNIPKLRVMPSTVRLKIKKLKKKAYFLY